MIVHFNYIILIIDINNFNNPITPYLKQEFLKLTLFK